MLCIVDLNAYNKIHSYQNLDKVIYAIKTHNILMISVICVNKNSFVGVLSKTSITQFASV